MDINDDLYLRLEKLNEIGAALSNERDINRLLEKILVAAKTITRADGGTLYRVTDDGLALRFEIVHNDSLGIALGGTSDKPVVFPDLPLKDENGQPNNAMVAAYAAIHAKTIVVDDAYCEAGFDFSGTRKFDAHTGYRSKSFLTVPMKNHENAIIGVLQLINAIDPASGSVKSFSTSEQRLTESLASQAAIALTNRQLIMQLEELFESFINLINLAIDEKSPYTGGHCQRVPTLTMMIADAVNQTTEGPLSAFKMNADDLYELKIAGLLHDCGKITTPVHVVDKATKLQTIYDRIGVVDTRFEVLKRDIQIATLRKLLDMREKTEPEAESACWATCWDALGKLDEDREFLRRANIGGETMNPADQQRVRDIGTQNTWRNPAGVEAEFLSGDEIENLTIKAGTLTGRERETINHHIVATIRMLKALPWPKHLQHVPEYAGAHHERMDGKGYPLGLTREQMSVPARMMGIADIFEALTARDRPYKQGMKLSQAIDIMNKFSDGGHIDPDLFKVFLQQQVHRQYAAAFLDPAQVD